MIKIKLGITSKFILATGAIALLAMAVFLFVTYETARSQLTVMLITDLAVSLAGVSLVAMLVRILVLGPLGRIIAGTQKIAAGDYAHRIEIRAGDEIGELAAAFNFMAGELEKAAAGLTKQSEELKVLVAARTGALEKTVAELENTRRRLEEKVAELQEFANLAVGRELKMIELEEEIRELKRKREP